MQRQHYNDIFRACWRVCQIENGLLKSGINFEAQKGEL